MQPSWPVTAMLTAGNDALRDPAPLLPTWRGAFRSSWAFIDDLNAQVDMTWLAVTSKTVVISQLPAAVVRLPRTSQATSTKFVRIKDYWNEPELTARSAELFEQAKQLQGPDPRGLPDGLRLLRATLREMGVALNDLEFRLARQASAHV